MNASYAPPASPPSTSARSQDAPRRLDPNDHRQQGDQFERLLRRKSAARDDDKDPAGEATTGETDAEASATGMPPGMWAALRPALSASISSLAAAASTDAKLGASKAGLGSATSADPGLAPAAQADAAVAWEVSVSEPMGVALAMRATGPAGAAAGSAGDPASWTLTIGSSALDAAAMLRHVPRLNERLRARSPHLSHVRIQGDDEEPS